MYICIYVYIYIYMWVYYLGHAYSGIWKDIMGNLRNLVEQHVSNKRVPIYR